MFTRVRGKLVGRPRLQVAYDHPVRDGVPGQKIVFPFGAESTPRPPRKPKGEAWVFVLGVYPSAVHVRWDLPLWAQTAERRAVGALAIADEPTVFWDGDGAERMVDAWMQEVGFRSGDEPTEWGHVRAVGNGTSGRPVRDRVLNALGVSEDETWFTDCADRFFIKRGGGSQQGDVIDTVYAPFAAALKLPAVSLPPRPSIPGLVRLAVTEHRERLRGELVEAGAPVVVTLGEEARRVLAEIVDHVDGPPLTHLARADVTQKTYGEPGVVKVGPLEAVWYAVAHPGNRDPAWAALHDAWIKRRRAERAEGNN